MRKKAGTKPRAIVSQGFMRLAAAKVTASMASCRRYQAADFALNASTLAPKDS